MMRTHRSVLKHHFQATFPTTAAEIHYCGSIVIWNLLREHPELAEGIEDKVIKLVTEVSQTLVFRFGRRGGDNQIICEKQHIG